MKWLVEVARDQFETVTADRFTIESGALWFYDRPLEPVASLAAIFAAGCWLTVVKAEEQQS